jgi:M6 family metalloprotease-like protein
LRAPCLSDPQRPLLLSIALILILGAVSSQIVRSDVEVAANNAETTITARLATAYPMNHSARYYLIDNVGSIELIPSPAGAGDLYRYNGATIEVSGYLVSQGNQRTLYMEKWVPLEARAAMGFSAVSGPQSTLVILIQWSNLAGANSVSYFNSLIFAGVNSMNAYYQEVSYGMIWVTGNPTPQWYALTHPYTYYNVHTWDSCVYGGDFWVLANDVVTLVDPYVNFASYQHIVLTFAGSGGQSVWGCAVSGLHIWTNDGVYFDRTTFLNEYYPMSVFAHEFGHDLGLPDLYDYSYTDPYHFIDGWDEMSMDNAQHLSSWSKMLLGWIPPAKVTTFNGIAFTTTIDRIEYSTTGYLALKIKTSTMPTLTYYLVETRQKVGFDLNLPSSAPDHGVLITKIDESQGSGDGIVRLVDANPSTQSSWDGDAVWQVGQTYRDSLYEFSIYVQAWTGTGFTITASYLVGVTITSSPGTGSGYVTVDGSPVVTPQIFNWDFGSTHPIAATSIVPCGSYCQHVFLSWSDSGAQTHTITVPSSPTTYTASYKTQYQLWISVYPSGGGSTDPAADSGYWYDSGTSASVSATAASGYSFYYWKLDGTNVGTNPSYSVTMNSAHTLEAMFRSTSSISLSFIVAPDGYAYILSGTITPTQPSPGIPTGTPVTLSYSSDSGTTWTSFTTVQTDSGGSYSVYWLQPYRYTDFRLRASWNGNTAYEGSTSTSLNSGGTYRPFYSQIYASATGPTSVARGASATFDVQVKCSVSSAGVYRTLYILVTGPDGYQYFDTVTAMVNIGETKGYQFTWDVPSTLTLGTYQIYFGLIPPYPTAISQTQIAVT